MGEPEEVSRVAEGSGGQSKEERTLLRGLCVCRSWVESVAGAYAAHKKVSPRCTPRERS